MSVPDSQYDYYAKVIKENNKPLMMKTKVPSIDPMKKPIKSINKGSFTPMAKPIKIGLPPEHSGVVDWAGNKFHYFKGQLHRKRGPAIEYANGSVEFWLNGLRVSFEDWKARVGSAYLDQVKQYADENDELKKEIAKLKTTMGAVQPVLLETQDTKKEITKEKLPPVEMSKDNIILEKDKHNLVVD
jgi:hypothetical protein